MKSNNRDTEKSITHGMDKINVHFLNKAKKELPLVLSPRFDNSLAFICEWLHVNRQWVQEQMLIYGAVLVRGFDITSSADFERAALAIDPSLCDKYRGTSPRSLQKGTKYTFSAADVPVNYPIAQHLEMSFLKAPPKNLYFCCMQESESEGGETSLCDFRKVMKCLPENLRHKFLTKKIKYSRRHYRVGEKFTYDVGAMKSWVQLFGTDSKEEVERISNEEDAPQVQWIGPNQDTFYQEWIDEPIQNHPVTNDEVWFNHSQVFHWSTFPAELWYSFCRLRSLQFFIHFVLVSVYTYIKYRVLGYTMALDTKFGDGTPITFEEMSEIRSAVHKNLVFSRWEKGDILCIDNFSTSHGRQPTYDRSRKVVVAWSQPETKPSLISKNQSLSTSLTSTTIGTNNDEDVAISSSSIMKMNNNDTILPDVLAVTPDSTPESSLTKEAAMELQNSFFHTSSSSPPPPELQNRRSNPNLLDANSNFWKKVN